MLLAGAIFVLTIVLVIWQPKGLGIGWSATLGAVLALVTGVVHPGDIPVVQVDRGGQVTYHGPGQLVAYLLLDVRKLGFGVRDLVSRLENSIIATLAHFGISAHNDPKRPGVYVGERKIASLGLRIKRGSVYHGLALNVNMDLAPFHQINPCGYAGLEMVQMAELVSPTPEFNQVADILADHLQQQLTVEEAHP